MNCKQYKLAAMEIAFGEAERTAEFDRHLELCGDCRKDFAAYAFAAKGIEDAPMPPAPSLSNERLHQAILSTNLRQRPSWVPRFALAGGVAVAALAVWIGFNRPVGEGDPSPPIAKVFEPEPDVRLAPEGPIEIPEAIPDLSKNSAVTSANSEPFRKARDRGHNAIASGTRRDAPVLVEDIEASVVPDELLAAAAGGAQSALDAEMSPARSGALMGPEPAPTTEPATSAIVIIQPEGQATEKSSHDVSIGG